MAHSVLIAFPNVCARMVLIAPRSMVHASANVDGLAVTVKVCALMATLGRTVQSSVNARLMRFVTGLTALVPVLANTKGYTVMTVSTASLQVT